MKTVFTTKRLCRAGVIAALYTVLTYVFLPFAFGPFQIRPAEALCILPLLFPEAVPALFLGCILSNLGSPYLLYDVTIGASATLLAAISTYMVGRFLKNERLKPVLGGIFPILFNAFLIPVLIVFLYGDTGSYASASIAYWAYFFSLLLTESVWVYALGLPLYYALKPKNKKDNT